MTKRTPRHGKSTAPTQRNPLLIPLILMCVLVIVLSVGYIAKYYYDLHKTQATNQQLLSLLNTPAPTAPTEPTQTLSQPSPTPLVRETEPNSETIVMHLATPPTEVDNAFRDLYALNSDLVGRVRIPCGSTPIDLLVVQRDNTFYLTHDFYGEPSQAGTVFLDQANVIWPQDQHLLIYGHNMKNGSMFARLTKFASFEFASYNPFVYFDTLYEQNTYVTVAALRLTAAQAQSDSFNIRSFIFGEAGFQAFLYQLLERALYVTNVDVDQTDQLLTLCTCSYSTNDERFLLVTRRLREGETEEALGQMLKDKYNGKE